MWQKYGWGWKTPNLLLSTIPELKHLRSVGKGPVDDKEKQIFRRANAILGQYAHDNECDVAGMPSYGGDIGILRGLVEEVAEQERLAIARWRALLKRGRELSQEIGSAGYRLRKHS